MPGEGGSLGLPGPPGPPGPAGIIGPAVNEFAFSEVIGNFVFSTDYGIVE